ncbi:MAG: DUF6444 domain-containing protein [Planctomycetaceae bacterium]|nr:hypothetical protein [Planctomycetaceae bacterium]
MSIPQFPISDEQLQALPSEFRAMMEMVKAFCRELINENQRLKARIATLEEQIARNSRNSSKPSSLDAAGAEGRFCQEIELQTAWQRLSTSSTSGLGHSTYPADRR